MRSIYRWKGELQDDTEVLMILKTRPERCEALAQRVKALHPYDVPEILALPATGGSDEYLEWVKLESSI